jgi:dihydroorotase-like cyclic amidohydrolase
MSTELLIRDVLAVLPDSLERVDIEIAGGRIAQILPAGGGAGGEHVIEGAGREAFPGVIDPHVHFRARDAHAVDGDDFRDVAAAAAAGGMTSVLAFVIGAPGTAGAEAVEAVIAAAGDVAVDFGLHHVLWPSDDHLARLDELAETGVRSFKMFMAYPERGLMFEGELALRALARVAEVDGIMLVHCEEGHAIRWLNRALAERLGERATLEDYYAARPERLEAAAVDLVGLWARIVGCPLYLVHMTTAGGVERGRRLVGAGQDVTLETCPQYLTLDPATVTALGPLGKFGPVVRDRAHADALWRALESGVVTVIGSDHAGHLARVKEAAGGERGILGVPYGIPGLETLFPLMYTHAVTTGRLTRHQLADLTSANAARRFGWYPRKGAIRVGSDADIVLIEPLAERTVVPERMRSRAGYSPYAGLPLRGWPVTTILRGRVTFDGQDVVATPGRFLETRPVQPARVAEPA